ncbi:hypothetical protein U1872_01190 [Sphingomonas sp. RB3P16]|uniref:DUF6894 family protein n=1 Tax=Parasphingomonas frigoris TaxID=3096163 RepID=UPI002FC7E3A8
MARYYFHILNQSSYVRDEVGLELASIESARDQASDAAGEILTTDLREGKTDVMFDVQVEDGSGVRLLTFHIAGTIEPGQRADPG